MDKKEIVVFSMLGPTRDAGRGNARWERWRPNVALGQQNDLLVRRVELFVASWAQSLANTIEGDLATVSPDTQVRQHPADFEDPWDFAEVYGYLHEFLRSYEFREEHESYLAHVTTGSHAWQVCLFLAVESRRLPGRLLQTIPPQRGEGSITGAYSTIDLNLARYEQLASRFAEEKREGVSLLKAGIETRNPAFNALMDRIELVAQESSEPILLAGPTGVGKTQLARRIYELRRQKRRVEGAFIEVNCATLRGEMAMSALFGHVEGAFTGANRKRDGFLRAADKGVLFLDEIGELGLDEQTMLLRALEERTFLPVGSDEPATSEFQLLAGTNRDLVDEVRAGRFREDLLARINLWSFDLPPLSERTEDLEPNLDWELTRLSRERDRRVSFQAEARRRFLTFAADPKSAWKANFRDFRASLTRLSTLAGSGRISSPLVEDEIERLLRNWKRLEEPSDTSKGEDLVARLLGSDADELDRFDRVQLEDVLRVCLESRSQSEAGRTLFAASRARRKSRNDADRLAKYLARFGLHWSDIVGGA